MFEVRVQQADFDINAELASLSRDNPAIGAIVTFTGKVRSSDKDRPLIAMTLEHYPGMAESQMAALIEEARQRWPLEAARIIHRTGRLTPEAQIVFVATCSAHRHAAFEAAEFLMDWLKTKAPFWKKEEYEGAEAQWVEARDADDLATARWDA